ncbi:MAG: NAD(P)/FAD-dependent oxidoreductase [Candidatus Thorarchaeota archaeon]|nr:NAD(P)/FAD-dependent oxidoreductase [Candidatus Thorarchaeota archaeon]
MKQSHYDTAVVGAGPAGLIAAKEIARRGHHVIVFEEHQKIGEPDHCAGLLSTSGLKALGLSPPKEVIQNHVLGARMFAPSGDYITVERGKREALVINRPRFDSWLGDLARKAGVEIETGVRVTDIGKDESGNRKLFLQREAENVSVTSSIVVNAEGHRGILSRKLGIPTVSRRNKYPAYQFEVQGANIDDDFVEMYYGRHVAPGFFAWFIPLGEGRARIGLAARNQARRRLESIMRHHSVLRNKVRNATILRGFGGVVLVGMPVNRTFSDGALVVGDAAGIVKPTTGGGVIFGGIASNVAGQIVNDALCQENYSIEMLRRYDSGWRSLLLRDLHSMSLAQRILSALADKGLNSLISDAHNYNLISIVRQEGDMDMQGRVISKLLSKPITLLAGLKAIRYLCSIP